VAAIAVSLLLAERVARVVSPALLHFLTRVLGFLLAAIAVELVVDGVRNPATG
jgi:small neutral amino acid transporter SnatA (MarC family)